eukprot:2367925-Heterocapsa_arctica.AAC.1
MQKRTNHDWSPQVIPMDVMIDSKSSHGTKLGHNIHLVKLLSDLTILQKASTTRTNRRNIWVPNYDMVMDGLKKELSDKSPVRKVVMTTHAMTPMLYTPTDKF